MRDLPPCNAGGTTDAGGARRMGSSIKTEGRQEDSLYGVLTRRPFVVSEAAANSPGSGRGAWPRAEAGGAAMQRPRVRFGACRRVCPQFRGLRPSSWALRPASPSHTTSRRPGYCARRARSVSLSVAETAECASCQREPAIGNGPWQRPNDRHQYPPAAAWYAGSLVVNEHGSPTNLVAPLCGRQPGQRVRWRTGQGPHPCVANGDKHVELGVEHAERQHAPAAADRAIHDRPRLDVRLSGLGRLRSSDAVNSPRSTTKLVETRCAEPGARCPAPRAPACSCRGRGSTTEGQGPRRPQTHRPVAVSERTRSRQDG